MTHDGDACASLRHVACVRAPAPHSTCRFHPVLPCHEPLNTEPHQTQPQPRANNPYCSSVTHQRQYARHRHYDGATASVPLLSVRLAVDGATDDAVISELPAVRMRRATAPAGPCCTAALPARPSKARWAAWAAARSASERMRSERRERTSAQVGRARGSSRLRVCREFVACGFCSAFHVAAMQSQERTACAVQAVTQGAVFFLPTGLEDWGSQLIMHAPQTHACVRAGPGWVMN